MVGYLYERLPCMSLKGDLQLCLEDNEEYEYSAPPPRYPPICGKNAKQNGVTHNLMSHFVSMDQSDELYGKVLNFESFFSWAV